MHNPNTTEQISYRPFTAYPEDVSGYTMITAIHPHHGVEISYLSLDEWQDNIKSVLTPYWINGYTVTMIAMD